MLNFVWNLNIFIENYQLTISVKKLTVFNQIQLSLFIKKWGKSFLFVGTLMSLFWTSGKVWPRFQSQGGFLACMLIAEPFFIQTLVHLDLQILVGPQNWVCNRVISFIFSELELCITVAWMYSSKITKQ